MVDVVIAPAVSNIVFRDEMLRNHSPIVFRLYTYIISVFVFNKGHNIDHALDLAYFDERVGLSAPEILIGLKVFPEHKKNGFL